MTDAALQPDRIDGAPHPRETPVLLGQAAAEQAFLQAFNSGKLHHGWLITGPRGVGKATLAWRIARFLLATPPAEAGFFAAPVPESLDVAPAHPVARRIASGGESRLKSITRSLNPDTKRLRKQIVVDDIRALSSFFQLSAADGGPRVVIIDDADQMNPSAANALLKMLEEPPARAVLLLISHRPSGLLPTLKSRCRTLRLRGLSADEMDAALSAAGVEPQEIGPGLADLAGGSVGEAIKLSQAGGLALYAEIIAILDSLPRLDRKRAIALAEASAQCGSEEKLALFFRLVDVALARLALAGALGGTLVPEAAPGEHAMLRRLSPSPPAARVWADLAQEVSARATHGLAVNLDPAALVLDTLQKIAGAAPRQDAGET
ncbi:MAG: DNA polymerase III subunit delta' [Pseudomonadota bacterium]